jgi:hypothetical protein
VDFQPDFEFFPTVVSFLPHFTEIMVQSTRADKKSQRKGRNATLGVAPLLQLHHPLLVSHLLKVELQVAASNAKKRIVAAKQQAQESKYPLWKYVTRHQGLKAKLKGGGNVLWTCGFFHNEFKSTYYRVKGHLLGQPCELGPCKSVSVSKRREMEKEDSVGLGKVAAACKKNKNEDPLPFVRNSSSQFQFGSGNGSATQQARKKATGPMDKIFQQEKRDEVDLTIGFFSTSFHSMLHGLLCLLRCVELYLIKLKPDMCLLVQRGSKPHYWLRQRRRWIKS